MSAKGVSTQRRKGAEAQQLSLAVDAKPKPRDLFISPVQDEGGRQVCLCVLCATNVHPLQREQHAKRHVRKGEAVEVNSPLGKTVTYSVVEPPSHQDTKEAK